MPVFSLMLFTYTHTHTQAQAYIPIHTLRKRIPTRIRWLVLSQWYNMSQTKDALAIMWKNIKDHCKSVCCCLLAPKNISIAVTYWGQNIKDSDPLCFCTRNIDSHSNYGIVYSWLNNNISLWVVFQNFSGNEESLLTFQIKCVHVTIGLNRTDISLNYCRYITWIAEHVMG